MTLFETCCVLLLQISFGGGRSDGAATETTDHQLLNLPDYFVTAFTHSSKETTFPTATCDDRTLRDLCFWRNETYRFRREFRIGTIGPPTRPDLCRVKNITYDILTGLDIVKLYPPDTESKFWTIGIGDDSLTRLMLEKQLTANISCSITTSDRSMDFEKLVVIDIEDTECSPLQAQDPLIRFIIRPGKLKKGHKFNNILFLDHIPIGTEYAPSISDGGSHPDSFQPNCTYHPDPRHLTNRTVIHCRIVVTRTIVFKKPLSFAFKLLRNSTVCVEGNTAYVNVTLDLESRRIKRSNVFSNNSKIFRTAAPYARVLQPNEPPKSMTNFECHTTNEKNNPFSITVEGIVYVSDTRALRKTYKEFLNLNITWTRNNVTQHEELTVRIVEEPFKTCTDRHSEDSWVVCSAFHTPKSCLSKNTCGLGTGGSTSVQQRSGPHRCLWRGDKRPENHETHFYSTCTSDTKYCPDGVCDSLEKLLEDDLCPQDCTKRVVFPTKLNEVTGEGVDRCNGILVCDMGCSCTVRDVGTNDTKLPAYKEEFVKEPDKAFCDIECILLSSGGVALVVLAIFVLPVCWGIVRKRKLNKDKYMENLPEAETPFSDYIERNVTGEPLVLNFHMTSSVENTSGFIPKTMPVDVKWRFPRQQILIEQVLGEGEFGKVLKAKAFNIAGRQGYSLVAVKTLKDDARKQDYNDLFSEYQLLKELNHPHVIQLLGVCSAEDGPLYVIIEYAALGSLRNYLRKSRRASNGNELPRQIDDNNVGEQVTPKDILSFARQIASGMSYLSDIKLVHRDLAARNILLAENKVCKISDFGLTRDIYEDNAYFKKSKGRVPVKWMAPESLADHLYTTKSDVWSFGILIWELITLGASPYPGIAVHNLYNLLKQGYRMERPPNCSTVLYSLMNRCWSIDPEERPTFLELYHCFDNLLTDKTNYLDLSDNAFVNKTYFATEFPAGTPDSGDKKINFLKHADEDDDDGKPSLEVAEHKFERSMEEARENNYCLGYETPVKNPRLILGPAAEDTPADYTDMSAQNHYENHKT